MKRTDILAGGFAALLLLALPAAGQDTPPEQQTEPTVSGPAPRLVLSTTEWDFGKKWRGEACSTEITLTNEGDAPLRILRIRKSCGCTPAQPKSGGSWRNKVIAPGESEVMVLSYDTTRHATNVSQTVTLETNDPQRPRVVIKVKGQVRPLFEAKPQDRIYFPRIEPEEVVTESIELRNNAPNKIFLKLEPLEESAPFAVKLEELEPGLRYRLSATTRPPLSLRGNRTTVVLTTGLERVPRLEIPVSVYVVPRVALRPAQWLVSPRVKREFRKRVRVEYRADKPIKITGIRSSHPDLIQAKLLPPRREPKPLSSAGGPLRRFAPFHELEVTIPSYDQLPEGGAWVEIQTDDPLPQYQKLTFRIRKQPLPASLKRPGREATKAARPEPDDQEPDD